MAASDGVPVDRARECKVLLEEGRCWRAVERFYREAVANPSLIWEVSEELREVRDTPFGSKGDARSLTKRPDHLIGVQFAFDVDEREYEPPHKRKQQSKSTMNRKTFGMKLAYVGSDFRGWAWQPDGNTVEKTISDALKPLLGQKRPAVYSAGRTDRGVSALAQCCSFHTTSAVTPEEVVGAINAFAPKSLSVWDCQLMPASFHATFSAAWRRYLYILPLHDTPEDKCIDAERINALLGPLVGEILNYTAFARDTPRAKETSCLLYRARAFEGHLPPTGDRVLCIEVIGNRFLRRMVRVLVSTCVRDCIYQKRDWECGPNTHTLRDYCSDALLGDEEARKRTAPAAPAAGLCFLGVGYAEPWYPSTT